MVRLWLGLLAAGLAAAVPDMNETNRTLHLAYASFCDEADLKNWSCMWCAGSGATVELIQFVANTSAGTQGYVGLDRAHARVVVGFRGSSNLANDVEDAAFLLLPPKHLAGVPPAGPGQPEVLVHTGFDFAYGSVRNVTQDAVTRALDSCGGACTEVTFTGHSLGSAMTTLAAVDFQAQQQRRQLQAAGGGGAAARALVSNLFTFGSPRVGNEAFAAWASGLLDMGLSSRVTREGDVVPRIPPKVVPLRGGNRYQHVHTREVWNRHNGTNQSHMASELDWLVECHAANGEDNNCSDSEPIRSYFEWAKGHEGCGQHCSYLGMLGGHC